MAFPYLPGATSPAFHAMVIFVGALITFASTGVIANIFSGILLVYTGGFKLNDIVQIGQLQGTVTAQGMVTTELRTFRNETVTIPNSVVANSHVTNYSRQAGGDGLIMHTTITIGYDVPWKQVHNLLVDAALATEDVLDTPQPFVLQTTLNNFNVSYDLNVLTKHPERLLLIYSHLHQNIQDAFNEAGIEILSPAYAALRDGNMIAIPEADRPKDYEPPGFRIRRQG
jgi:small-conductance mechanosensitive channel